MKKGAETQPCIFGQQINVGNYHTKIFFDHVKCSRKETKNFRNDNRTTVEYIIYANTSLEKESYSALQQKDDMVRLEFKIEITALETGARTLFGKAYGMDYPLGR